MVDQPPIQPNYSEVRRPDAKDQESIAKEKERRRNEEEDKRQKAINADLRSKTKDTNQR